MNIALWVVQVLTALAFGGHGWLMTFGLQRMTARVPWVRALPAPFVRLLGVLEILGAIGVVIPAATGVLPSLTVAAAGGLVAVMPLAILVHTPPRPSPYTRLKHVLGGT